MGTSVRSERPDLDVVHAFLAAADIAIVGVHRDTRQFANQVHRTLRSPERTVHPVHPEAETIEGDTCVATVADLPGQVRDVLVMVRPDRVDEVMEACIARGVDRVWLHRGAGTGSVTETAVQRGREAGIEVVAGACPLMFAEPVGWFHRIHRRLAIGRVRAPV